MSEITLESQLFEIIQDKEMAEHIKLAKVDMLIRLGVDVNAMYRAKSALRLANEIGAEKVAEFLEENGVKDIFDEEKANVLGIELVEECKNANFEKVKELVEKGADVNAKNIWEITALMWASINGHKEVAEFLVERGADVNIKGKDERTALMLASSNGHKEVVELLVAKGADVNQKDYDGYTALMTAVRNKDKEMAELLILNGADIEGKLGEGVTLLMFASRFGYKEIVELLISKGANINAKDRNDNTPLSFALQYKQIEVAKLLMEKGAIMDASFKGRFGSLDSEFQKMIDNAVEKESKNDIGNPIKILKKWFER